jgi:hypothetical protein
VAEMGNLIGIFLKSVLASGPLPELPLQCRRPELAGCEMEEIRPWSREQRHG